MTSQDLGYPPLDVLKPIADDVWIVDAGPILALGLPLPVRMTVVRLSSGELLLYSPTPWTQSLGDSLEALGPIGHLVAPNIGHWMFLGEWQSRYPQATTWAAPGLSRRPQVKNAGVRIDHELGHGAPAAWAADLDQVAVRGVGFVEIALFHRESRTLMLCDLLSCVEEEALPPPKAQVLKAVGVASPDARPAVYLRLSLKVKRRQAEIAARRLVALDPERVVFAHGRWLEANGAARLRQALSFLLDGAATPRLGGKVVVVTGASSGIGRATAVLFARQGAKVVLAARRAEVLEQVARDCEAAGAEALVVPTDVTDPEAVKRLAEQADEAFGGIDVWINNAGVGVFGPYQNADIALHRRTVEVNLLGTMHGAWAVLPVFLRQDRGLLINNISLGGWAPIPFAAAYTASKFGLRGFSASLRQELANHPDIHVCAIFPAMVDTPGFVHGANVSGASIDPGPLLYRAEDVAQAFLSVVERPRDETAVGWPARLGQAAFALAPAFTQRSTSFVFRALLKSAKPAPATDGAVLQPRPEGVDASGHWLERKNLPAAKVISLGLGAVAAVGLIAIASAAGARRLAPRR